MGIYEYQCPNGHVTEKMQSMSDRQRPVTCDHCAEMAQFIVSATPTTFHANDRKAIKGTTIRGGRRT